MAPLFFQCSFFDQAARDGESEFAHFYNLLPLGQKSVIQIFGKLSGCKIIKQNGGSDFSDFNNMYMHYP